ncbi:hypothetical protein [Cerasicoccus frondis]|uniref:hypothetical protein n=1 Tax=Cerasicoccus frondis TaxID=490090 RepID=UPI0028527998|nr:hypothetical protein [Cerasicoccus frondis]
MTDQQSKNDLKESIEQSVHYSLTILANLDYAYGLLAAALECSDTFPVSLIKDIEQAIKVHEDTRSARISYKERIVKVKYHPHLEDELMPF